LEVAVYSVGLVQGRYSTIMGVALTKALANVQSQPVRLYLMHAVSRLLGFWLPHYALYLMKRKGLGFQWKIQGQKSPKRILSQADAAEAWKGDIIGQIVVQFLMTKFMKLGTNSSSAKAIKGNSEDGTENEERGWSGLRSTGPAPKWYTHVWQVAVAYLGYDTMFYWTHRLMHHPKLYKHCHKIHHEYHTPIALACAHHHAVEGLVQLFNWFVPIAFAGWLNKGNGGLHESTLFYYNSFRWLETVDAHCGYELPFSPFKILPFCGGARGHDFHHREFNGNYGATIFWDRICGTDSDFWKELGEEGLLLAGVRQPL